MIEDAVVNAANTQAPHSLNAELFTVGSAVSQVGHGEMVPSGSIVGNGMGLNVGSSVTNSVGIGLNRAPSLGVGAGDGGSVGASPS
mmetsp:Transcript_19503/g.43411  ORF Transcript_19503/g.43411 Transcript_19503/m.43411 type:complete len:86 (+) Transcript_19503:663-920(+)